MRRHASDREAFYCAVMFRLKNARRGSSERQRQPGRYRSPRRYSSRVHAVAAIRELVGRCTIARDILSRDPCYRCGRSSSSCPDPSSTTIEEATQNQVGAQAMYFL